MRFVTTDVVRIPLKNGIDWIEVKTELSVGEDRRYRTAGLTRFRPDKAVKGEEPSAAIDVDFEKMAFARAEAYLVDWNAKRADGKDVPLTPSALRALHPDDFAEIDEAIQHHIEERDAVKKTTSGAPQLTSTSA